MNAEVFRHLRDRDPGLTIPRDPDDVLTELLGKYFGHDDILPGWPRTSHAECHQLLQQTLHAKNRHGNIYPYFICLGRNNKRTTCDMPYAPAGRVEQLVADYYKRITLTPAMADALRGMLMHEFDQLTAGTNQSIRDLTDRRKQILAEQDKLLEAHLADALSLDQLKKFQTRLRAELDGIEAQIAEHHNDYQGARALIDGALGLARDFAAVYERCDEQNKRLANQTFFTRIYLNEDDTLTADTAAPFESILDETTKQQAIAWADQHTASNKKSDVVTRDLFLQARVTTSLIECPKRDETVTSFATLKSLISRGSSDGEDWCDSSVSVPRSDNRGPVVTPIGTAVTPFPAEDLQQMIAAYKAGASLYTIACEWKLGKQTVRRKLDEAGVRIRRKGLDDEQVVRAVSGYESGQTIREVAADLGVGHSMVWRALKKAGVELRDNVRRVGRKLSSQ